MKNIRAFLVAVACLLPAMAMAATVTLNPVADAYVRDLSTAAVNYGTATELRVQNGGTRINHESYLKFDASAASGQISSAKLRVYAALSGVGSVSTSAYAVGNTSWGETTITWNNKPALGNSLGSVSVSSTAYAWQEIDVTAYVQSERAAGRSVISLGLRSNSLPSKVYVSASSREGANPPELVLVTNDAPSVSLTAPIAGSSYTAPASITLSATAADADGSVASVEFYNGATLIGAGTLTGGSYTLGWTSVGAGSYSVTAKATDNLGAVTVSAPVSISVNGAPSVSVTAPLDGSSYTAPASITLTADATDSDGSIAAVEFHDGATLIASLTAPPYSYTWNDVPAGSHVITAKATDNQGTASTSAPVTVTVSVPLASGVYYIHADHLNTPRVITDASNKVVWRWDSDPFGAEKANEDPDGAGAKFTYNLRFPGQYYDRETNLHYNYFRDYDPTTGRYVQSDPIGLAGGINTYGYVGGNPLSSSDPEGLLSIAACANPANAVVCAEAGIAARPMLIPMAMPKDGSSAKAQPRTVAEFCPKCQATATRSQAKAQAYAWAGMSPGAGSPTPWSNFNPPGGNSFRKGAVWADFMKRYYPPNFGASAPTGVVEEHPFGHPGIPGGQNHDCPHFVAVNSSGISREFPYKPGSP